MEHTPEPENTKKTILVVDDETSVLSFVSGFLVTSNYNVLTANNGTDALQQSKDCKSETHLLLPDFQMPGISGIDLATHISLERPDIKVLLMSGFTQGMPCSQRRMAFSS